MTPRPIRQANAGDGELAVSEHTEGHYALLEGEFPADHGTWLRHRPAVVRRRAMRRWRAHSGGRIAAFARAGYARVPRTGASTCDHWAVRGGIDSLFDDAGCTGAIHVRRLSDRAEVALRADEAWLAASTIKVAIGLEFYAQADDGRLDPTRMITLGTAQRTPGPTGISAAEDPVTMSLRDLCGAMLAVSDNGATDAVLEAVGIAAVNDRLAGLGCTSTELVESIGESIDALAVDLGFADYVTLLRAQAGELGTDAQQVSIDQERIGASRVLDPARATHTTARDMTHLLGAVWQNQAASEAACANLRRAMSGQVARRLAPAVPEGGGLAAKSGSLFGRVRNEVGVITTPAGECYALAVLTRAHRPFVGTAQIDHAMAEASRVAVENLCALGDRD